MVMQRGAGFCTVKSTPDREKAAALFLKWLTEPQTNARFVTSLGYMPVTAEAFRILPDYISNLKDAKYRSLYEAFLTTQASYEFYTVPQIKDYLEIEQAFEKNIRSRLRTACSSFKNGGQDKEKLKAQVLENLQASLPQ